jgi:hypothetical protein
MQNAPNPSCFGVFHLQINPFKDSPWLASLMMLSACQESNTNAEVKKEVPGPLFSEDVMF